jgi:hypothetical protein
VHRISIFFAGTQSEAETLQDRIAAVMDAELPRVDEADTGYVVALARIDEPLDDEAFVALVEAEALRILLGPADALAG